MRDLDVWQDIFEAKARELYPATDPSHDFLHIRRVATTAMELAGQERADVMIVLPAAYFVNLQTIPPPITKLSSPLVEPSPKFGPPV